MPAGTIHEFEFKELDVQVMRDLVPVLDLSQESVVVVSQSYMCQCDEIIARLIQEKYTPLAIHKTRSLMIDRLLTSLFDKFSKEIITTKNPQSHSCALMATGGYGREEMSMLSDIDLLLVYDDGLESFSKPLIEKILYVLWDLKFEVGHAVRTPTECKRFMQEDLTIFTALLDVRLICGEKKYWDAVTEIRDGALNNTKFVKRFVKGKIDERNERLKKFGGTVYLLEPHVKEGEGTLRDLQLFRWLAFSLGIRDGFEGLLSAGYIDEPTCYFLSQALEYFLNLRNRLHILTKKKGDQINFQTQIALAQNLGFSDDDVTLGVEKFMQGYYAVAAQVNTHLKSLIQKINASQQNWYSGFLARLKVKKLDKDFRIINEKIAVSSKYLFEREPEAMMRLFEHVQQTGYGVHFGTKDLVLQNIHRVDEAFRANPEINAQFRRMMANYHNLSKALFAMHALHFFDAFIPEFRHLRNRMQHDVYHVYTVDTHSIFAVAELTKLLDHPDYQKRFPSYHQAMLAVKRRDLLSLGVLFHDIGKGLGGNHSVVGAEMANAIMTRMGYSDEDRKIVEFLVLSHLLMPHLSQRRDLEDFHMVSEFAKAMQTMSHLNMLYVLTWADIRAVSNEAWTEWKGNLLKSLYEKTSQIISGQEQLEDIVQKRVVDVREAILARMQDHVDQKKLQGFLQSISPRYVLAHADHEILDHFQLLTAHDDDSFLFIEKSLSLDTVSEVLIYTLQNPRVFPLITGVMLSLDVNILTMENFTLTDGHVFIKMHVQSRAKQSLSKANLVERVRRNLQYVFTGAQTVDDLIAKRRQPDFMLKRPVQIAKTNVTIDTDVSAYYTVIDVFTHDRLGLLYDIVKCLVAQGCYVDVSKISTKVEQVVDTFYVKDIFGQKITAKAKLSEIKQALFDVIEEKPVAEKRVKG